MQVRMVVPTLIISKVDVAEHGMDHSAYLGTCRHRQGNECLKSMEGMTRAP